MAGSSKSNSTKAAGNAPGLRLFLTTAATIVVLDQCSKACVTTCFGLYESKTVIPGLFSLTHITNTGVAFGLMSGEGGAWKQYGFLLVSLLAIGLIVHFFRQMKTQGPMPVLALGMLLGGAVGNTIDRLRLGNVVDFLDFYVGRHHWPAFNVADAAITCGVFFLLWSMHRHSE